MVTILGDGFPGRPIVTFGETLAEVVVAEPTAIVVRTRPAPPGLVAITVADRSGDPTATLADAFAFESEGDDPPVPTTTSPTPTTTIPVSSPTVAPTTTTPPAPGPTPTGGDIDDWLDGMLRTPAGLELAEPPQGSAILQISVLDWAGNMCDEPECPGWVIRDD